MFAFLPRWRGSFVLAGVGLLLFTGCPPTAPVDLTPAGNSGTHLFRFAHITDPQIVDEESPARAVRFTDFNRSAWRPQEAFGVHTLDATLQVVNRLHREAPWRPVGFLVVTGDLVDLAQRNELQWFIDTMDGNVVTADSGETDGVVRTDNPQLNPKLPYDAVGLDPTIPWYTCFGNHDGLAVGTFPIDRSLAQAADWSAPLLPVVADFLGLRDLGLGGDRLFATDDWSPAVLAGSGVPLLAESYRLDLSQVVAGPVVPDRERQFLSKADFIALHLESDTEPPGHGFTEVALAEGRTHYVAHPVPGVPLRLIVFDTVAHDARPGFPAHFGTLAPAHFTDFVLPQLEAAAAAGDWVILASHHPSTDFDQGLVGARVRTHTFRAAVASYPNVIMHLNGHTHRHRSDRVEGPYPYLEIATASVIDYPQEGRLLDVFLEADGATLRIESVAFGHQESPTVFSAESFRLAEIDRANRLGTPSGTGAAEGHGSIIGDKGNFRIRLPRDDTQVVGNSVGSVSSNQAPPFSLLP